MGNIHPLTIYPNSKTTVEAPANEFTVSNNLAKQGRCPRCGIQTHNSEKYHGLFFLGSHLVPLTNDHVMNGRCTSCNPLSKCNVIEDADDEVLSPVAPLKAVPHNDVSIIQVPPVSERGDCDLRLKGKKMIAGLTVLILVVIAVVLCAKFGVFKFHDDTNTTTNTTSKSETPTRASVTTEIAQYDGGLGAPKCSQVSSSCDSGPLLLAGKGPDEANFPGNTIDDCWEYGMGTYHEDSSIDGIVVSTIDMTDFKPGSTVQIDAKIWGIAEQDATSIHFFYTADATDPSWQFIETVDKISAGESTVSTQYILPNGSLQAVRVVCRDVSIANPCPQGGGDDIDDLVFAVGNSPTSEPPTRASVTTEIAQYDGGLGAPKCSQVSSSCYSGPLLLAGKGPDEANFPGNTIDDCWEYGMGTYHKDSSIDSIVVSTIDMTDFKPGSTVQIDAKIWGIAEQDATSIHFFYTADATDPSWQFIETVDKISAGKSTVSTQYILPNGSLQAVRVVCRDVGIANPCPQGGGDDIDDLVFAVG